ncbi:hypothetical protein JCGZ_07119 [Jatropha curcas]|uniref:Uncharacterized protein n=1 Tax=Jatropha curcas TaxID=180498 RepID=A0A067KEV6_JATCU|nr:uncharacterized protein LOC105638320 [Jatropha curcas]KDP33548.1 hypothetical protein JCGZ_07119 [Jatropha curcas]
MANPLGKPVAIGESSSPLAETGYCFEDCEEQAAAYFSSSCCCCFYLKRNSNGSRRYLLGRKQEEIDNKESWVVEKAKKVKEISEVLAGPKWKNFIRRCSSVHGYGFCSKKTSKMQYQYDPQSYALNFDDGIDKELEDSFPGFSARYATPLGRT